MTRWHAARALAVSALALFAQGAQAVEMHGYFRDSEGFNTKGGTQVCFQLPGSDFKARLGNECDRYLEIAFSETGKIGDWQWRAEFMPASYLFSGDSSASNNLFLQQMWVGMKNLDWGASFWAGRRYWKRHDVHSLDWFYWNPAQGNVGAGVEDVDVHFGKLAISAFRIDATTAPTAGGVNLTRGTYAVPEIRLYDIPLYTNGTLEAGVDLGIAVDQGQALGAGRAALSPLATLQHNQANLLGGSNTLALQFGSGAFAKESGDGAGQLIAGAKSTTRQWRVVEHLVVHPVPLLSGALVLVYQDKSEEGAGSRIFTGELRPAVHLTDWFKVQADFFYQALSYKNADAGAGSPALFKATLAPTLVLGREYFTRPELRLFATYASWNDAAAAAGTMASGAFGTAKNGVTLGASVETWF